MDGIRLAARLATRVRSGVAPSVLALAVAACGGDDDASGRSGATSSGTSPVGSGIADGTGGGLPPGTAPEGGGASGGGGSDNICEEVAVRADRATPDMLIVLDKSGSMGQEGRWRPSQNAVKAITSELEDSIRFGLMMFPGDGGASMGGGFDFGDIFGGGFGSGCEVGELYVPVDANNASQIAGEVDGAFSNGGTPTGETLEAALQEFSAQQQIPDRIVPPQYVLLTTDGQPTCPAGDGSETTQADITLADNAIQALRDIGVTTYVIGYDTKGDPELAGVLDNFAAIGGTGTHRAVENQDELLDEFREIAGEIVSCSYTLEAEPEDPTFVQVKLDGMQINLNDADGWTLTGQTVQLEGAACNTLRDGADHLLTVEVLCTQVTPI